jgi:hypothetical protein
LGTPASGTLTNTTGFPAANLAGLGANVATFLATPSSANLAAAVTDETGSGALVFATSPTLVTPALGTPSALVGTNISGTAASLTAGVASTVATANEASDTTCFFAFMTASGTANQAIKNNTNATFNSSTGAAGFASLTLTTDLPVTEGGTGASTAAAARTNLFGVSTTVDNTISRYDGTTGAIQSSGVIIDDANELYGYTAKFKDEVGTTYTTVDSDTGKILTFDNGSAIAVTLHATAPVGTAFTWEQKNTGQVTFASTGSGTMVNRQSHTKSAGRYACGTLFVHANSGGSAAVWVLAGDTSA